MAEDRDQQECKKGMFWHSVLNFVKVDHLIFTPVQTLRLSVCLEVSVPCFRMLSFGIRANKGIFKSPEKEQSV